MTFPGENLCPPEYRQFFIDLYTHCVFQDEYACKFKGLENAPVVDGTPYLAASMIHEKTSFPFLLNITTMEIVNCILERNYYKFIHEAYNVFGLLRKTGAVKDKDKNVTPKKVMSKLLDGLNDDFKDKVLCIMDEEGIHNIKLLVGNEAYSKAFCGKLCEFGSVASDILFDRLMASPNKSKKRTLDLVDESFVEEAKTDDTKRTFLKSVEISNVAFYSPDQIMRFRDRPQMLINKFRILGYNERGETDFNAPLICIEPSHGNCVTFLALQSKCTLRIPGIYTYYEKSSSPLEYVADKFSACLAREETKDQCLSRFRSGQMDSEIISRSRENA